MPKSSVLFIGISIVVLSFVMSQVTHHPQASENTMVTTQGSSSIRLVVTGQSWYKESVVRIMNASNASYSHFQVYSASGNALPILYIGNSPPSSMTLDNPLADPPYTLGPHESAWVADASPTPTTEYVQWFNGTTNVDVFLKTTVH